MYQCKLGLITAAVLLGLLVSAGVAETLPVWHSYDATIRTVGDGLIRGDIVDANNGINAELKFYMSSDVLGVAEAATVTTGGDGLWSNVVCQANGPSANWGDDLYLIMDFSSHWRLPGGNGSLATNLGATEWFVPFVGKQLSTNHLSFHPPSTDTGVEGQFKNHLGVIAFIAPQDGEYEITNFGARAMQTNTGAPDRAVQSVHIIDDRTGTVVLDSIACGGIIEGSRDITWKFSPNTTTMQLLAGDEIHFAVHATDTFVAIPADPGGTEEFYWDATNVAFDITLIPEPSTLLLAAIGFLGVGLVGWRRRKRA